ncbi:unnamed protein product [Linum tenue]|uniref:TIR domain-containing protein n=1 Tax=Linum tenue TaxID=586396 RepID=A0AAV0IQL4_9ROSI|nr:unnamed protein product [Linum tenue]
MSTLFLHLFLFLLHIILLSRLLLPRWIQTKLRHHLFATPPPSSATSSSPAAFDSVEPVPKTGKNPFPLTLLPKYDVFISFRGEDVRDTFLSHLYSHLSDNKKVCAYKDDRDLGRGEQISASLVEAIERSTVYLVIFSPNYANSRWCLEELVKILDCSRRYGRKVIPVFYGGSDPSQVRNQTGSYADAFARRYRNLPVEKVHGWRAALREAANISGFDSRITRPETDLIKEISKAVVERMHSQMMLPSNATYGLVGVEKSMRAIGLSLCIETEANWTIGLCGMGGIGKTTLAKAIYDQFSNQFEASCFVSNFADHLSRLPQLFDGLQNELFSRLLPNENGYSIPASFKLNRLRRIKALIVIDDVDNIKQLEDLFDRRYCDLFGPGSRILLTSRNKQLLKNVCHQIYVVNPLDDNESLQLFCLHAFKEDHPPPGYLWASNLAITYASGNPLALKVLGSNLYGRNKEFWDCELNMLRNRPDEDVKNVVLRRSYDGLNEVEKSAYLDIACFYDPWGSTYDMLGKFEEKVLDGCYAEYGGSCNLVTKLVDKSLLSIGDSLGIQMHRLLQDLGRNIVNEERSVGKRSRLWEAKDIYNLLIQKKASVKTTYHP